MVATRLFFCADEGIFTKEDAAMLIHVQYSDSRYDMVKEFWLDELIENKRIIKFRRRDSWVVIGVDPVRKPKSGGSYQGPERRTSAAPAQTCFFS